ncbi:MAG TPA: hypothetical protein PLV13_08420, partial [Ilumatobacteraceae bacterium]|nr:hypothetical protein [Ilumatobacteraceae bacterium]
MDKRTATAATSMVALTFALGTAAFATLGGFGPLEQADSAPTIVTDLVVTTVPAPAADSTAVTAAPAAQAPT